MRWAKKQGQGSHCQMPFKQFRGGQSSCRKHFKFFAHTISAPFWDQKQIAFKPFNPEAIFMGSWHDHGLRATSAAVPLLQFGAFDVFQDNLVDLHGPMITAGSCCSPSHALHLISWPQDWIGLWAFLEWFACVSLLERCLNKEVVRCKVSSVRELLQLQRLVLEGNSEAEE